MTTLSLTSFRHRLVTRLSRIDDIELCLWVDCLMDALSERWQVAQAEALAGHPSPGQLAALTDCLTRLYSDAAVALGPLGPPNRRRRGRPPMSLPTP